MLRLRPTRVLAICGIVLVAFLYWKPLHTYLRTKSELQASTADVRALRVEEQRLQASIAAADRGDQLLREARRLGLVKPNERLFIVRGIDAWRHQKH
ncbi:MAG TPA: septum formation initiator family protein [Gaiellaceae bacterium]|nr:septum formation initiator family protein [Gaiellaceae bacterium]